jgi:hypothetical protein
MTDAAVGRVEAVAAAVEKLSEFVALRCGELADEVLGRPVFGSEEWLRSRERPEEEQRETLREWHLVKVGIKVGAGIDPVGDVVNARRAGASWELVGQAAGMSRQAAHERWARRVELVSAGASIPAE